MSTTTTVVELSDDMRELMRELTGFAGSQLEGVDTAAGTAALDEYARQFAVVRALWAAIETGVIAEEYVRDLVRIVQEERDYCEPELARRCDDLRTFIIREDPGLRFHDDRGETLNTYRKEIEHLRRNLARCDEFLEAYA